MTAMNGWVLVDDEIRQQAHLWWLAYGRDTLHGPVRDRRIASQLVEDFDLRFDPHRFLREVEEAIRKVMLQPTVLSLVLVCRWVQLQDALERDIPPTDLADREVAFRNAVTAAYQLGISPEGWHYETSMVLILADRARLAMDIPAPVR